MDILISIHAPAKGATTGAENECIIINNFNPRSREGSDYRVFLVKFPLFAISIHAPAKGATASPGHSGAHLAHFNPRSREGSDIGLTS